MTFSPKESLKTVRIIHFALMMGIIIFAMVVLFLIFNDEINSDPIPELDYVPWVCLVVAIPLSRVLFNQTVKPKLDGDMTLQEKLMTFQTGHIIRMAILEGCGLFSTVIAFVNQNPYNLIVVGLVIAFMASKIPSVMLLETELRLNSDERNQFD